MKFSSLQKIQRAQQSLFGSQMLGSNKKSHGCQSFEPSSKTSNVLKPCRFPADQRLLKHSKHAPELAKG